MGAELTDSQVVGHTVRVGRKPLTGAVPVKINLTPDDLRHIDAVKSAFGLGDRSATLRFAVRELVRRDKIKLEPLPEEG